MLFTVTVAASLPSSVIVTVSPMAAFAGSFVGTSSTDAGGVLSAGGAEGGGVNSVATGAAAVACLPLVEPELNRTAMRTMLPMMNNAIPAATPMAILVTVNCRFGLGG